MKRSLDDSGEDLIGGSINSKRLAPWRARRYPWKGRNPGRGRLQTGAAPDLLWLTRANQSLVRSAPCCMF